MADLAKDAYFMPPVIAADHYRKSREFAEIVEYLPESKGRALDLGAGNGILSYALADIGWAVTAVEPDPSALVGAGAIRTVVAETGVQIEVVEAFGEDIPIDAPFDLVVARQVLHHANDLPAFCSEIARLSRAGATVLTLRDHVISNSEQLQPFLDSHPLHHLYGGENAFKLSEYRSALENAGINIRHEWKSFQSPINYAPLDDSQLKERIADSTGPIKSITSILLNIIPFSLVKSVATLVDRRPGRLVSYLGERAA